MSRLSIDIPDELHRAIKSEASLRGLNLRAYVLRRVGTSEHCEPKADRPRFSDSGLSGLWADRNDMADPDAWVRDQRKSRQFEQSPADDAD